MFRSRPFTFTNVTVLAAEGIIGHSLRVRGKQVVALDQPPQKDDLIIDGRGGLIVPGLINAHDHLSLNNFPRLKYRRCYPNASQWVADIEARFDSDPALTTPRQQPLSDRLFQGALKNLLCGVTTVCHHDPDYRPLRRRFPLRLVRPYQYCHSLYLEADVVQSYRQTKADTPWIIHLAEGTDEAARHELGQLAAMNALQANTVLVHGVGLTPADQQQVARQGGGLIWCPGSNHFFFGQTAAVRFLQQKGKVALGSDSRLSGEFDLLAEIRCAHQTGQVTAAELFRQVTVQPAGILNIRQGGQGQLQPGGIADLLLLPPPIPANPYERLLPLQRSQIECVLFAGQPIITGTKLDTLFKATRTPFAPVRLDGHNKLLANHLAKRLSKTAVPEPGLSL